MATKIKFTGYMREMMIVMMLRKSLCVKCALLSPSPEKTSDYTNKDSTKMRDPLLVIMIAANFMIAFKLCHFTIL